MALALHHKNADIADLFRNPPPVQKLEVRMPRVFSTTSVGVTYRDMRFEPMPNELFLIYEPDEECEEDRVTIELHDEQNSDWLKGREVELANLLPGMSYKVWLRCTNEVGTTNGQVVTISTRAGPGRSAKVAEES
eukprot:gene365-685_t